MATEVVYLVTSPERHSDSDVEFSTLEAAREHIAVLYSEDGEPDEIVPDPHALLMRMPSVFAIYRVERELVEEIEHPLMDGVRKPTYAETHRACGDGGCYLDIGHAGEHRRAS